MVSDLGIERAIHPGNAFLARGDRPAALAAFRSTWESLPEPREQHPAAAALLTAIGDVLFLEQDYEGAVEALYRALQCPGAAEGIWPVIRLMQADHLGKRRSGCLRGIFARMRPRLSRPAREARQRAYEAYIAVLQNDPPRPGPSADFVRPPWVEFPNSAPWMGWNQGTAEAWRIGVFGPFWASLSAAEREAWLEQWPPPNQEWREQLMSVWL